MGRANIDTKLTTTQDTDIKRKAQCKLRTQTQLASTEVTCCCGFCKTQGTLTGTKANLLVLIFSSGVRRLMPRVILRRLGRHPNVNGAQANQRLHPRPRTPRTKNQGSCQKSGNERLCGVHLWCQTKLSIQQRREGRQLGRLSLKR